MSRVLIVDDERDYCDELELGLGRRGHEVKTAGTAREAIRLGVRYRPDVLVVDWMLKDSLHGLNVCEVLRAVEPEVQTVLITGFASDDLRLEAAKHRVFNFLEKPFTLADINTAVRDAAKGPPPPPPDFLPAVLEVDAAGAIIYANRRAGELFDEAQTEPDPTSLSDLFGRETVDDLAECSRRWVEVSPKTPEPTEWHLRSREWAGAGHRLFLLLSEEDRRYKHGRVVSMLFEIPAPPHTRWPVESHALIVDREDAFRLRVTRELEHTGCLCHAAHCEEAALLLFYRDPDIGVVVVDYDTVEGDVRFLIDEVRVRRPGVTIIGAGTHRHRGQFAVAGVDRFLQKPYYANDLINRITNRIGDCSFCGLPTPLRRPQPGEAGGSWVCCGCGACYHAVLDDAFPSDMVRHVSSA